MHGQNHIKGNLPFHTMETYRGSRIIAPPILNRGTRWRGVVSFTFRLVYPE